MSGDTYSVDGNVEWMAEGMFLDVIKNSLDVANIFRPETVNVRRARDATVAKSFPGIGIEASVEQALRGSNEYKCTMRFFCETDPYKIDKTGEQVKALIGVLRDILHAVDIIDQLNESARGIQMNSPGSLSESTSEDDSISEGGNQVRRMILQADAHVYVGRAS